MPFSAQENYLTTEVMTATPQRLQLILVEAAIRSCEQARRCWAANQTEQACEALIHAESIVTELLARLNQEGDPEMAKRIASVYLFVFRSLVDANLKHDETKLKDAIRVLETERETWQEVCRRFGSSDASQAAGRVSLSEERIATAAPILNVPEMSDEGYTGFSLEA